MSHVGEKCNHSRVVIESSLDFTKGETCDEKYSSIQMEERVLLKRALGKDSGKKETGRE